MKELPAPLCVRYYRLTQDRSVLLVELTHLYTDRFSEELLMSELLGHGEDVRDRFHDYQLAMRDLESVDHKEAAEFWDKFSKEAEEKKIRSLSSVYDSGPWKKCTIRTGIFSGWGRSFPRLSGNTRHGPA